MDKHSGPTSLALLGPMPPHRGGIAQYGLHLHHALSESFSTTTFAFSRQYPAWLYPGASDIEPDAGPMLTEGVVRTIDSLNPLSWWEAANAIIKSNPTALVIQWWTIFWWPTFMLITWQVRRHHIPVVVLCHNLVDHETSSWKDILSASMLRLADGYIVHSTAHRDALERRYPGRPLMLAPIPSYSQIARPKQPLAQRGRLELLFFGFIRPYKGLDVLLDAIEQMDDPDVYLTVAGEAWDDCRDTVERLLRLSGRNVETQLEFVSEARAAELFDRADAVILPYRAASGSAVTALAYGFDKPIIASRVGGLIDAVIEGETGIFVEPGNAVDLANVLLATSREKMKAMSGRVAQHRAGHGWSEFAVKVGELVRNVRNFGG